MSKSLLLSRARNLIGPFTGDDRGNVAVIFAIALLPILSFVGAAIDYTRASSARSAMQSALDSTSLMVLRDVVAGTISASDTSTKAQSYFNALYTDKNAAEIAITTTYTPRNSNGTSSVSVNGTAQVNTEFLKVAGYSKLGINTASTASLGGTRMRVAMALDVTGSMNSDNKLVEMKKAANNLITTLKGLATTNDDVYISIVPFAQMVNVGTSNKNAAWIDWSAWEETNGSCSRSRYTTKSTCLDAGRTWTADNHNNWAGCVMDRDQPADTTKDAPTPTTNRYPAAQYEQNGVNICPAEVLPMTSVTNDPQDAIGKKINSLVAVGGTNQPIGIAMAWQTLQSGSPFNTPVKDSNYKYTDVLIVLSDGLNTIDRWYGNGYDPSPDVDARQTLLCNNIKKTDATINPDTIVHTIQVNTDGDPESAVLKACISKSGSFFPTSTAGGIATAFTSIGSSLSKLRISQ